MGIHRNDPFQGREPQSPIFVPAATGKAAGRHTGALHSVIRSELIDWKNKDGSSIKIVDCGLRDAGDSLGTAQPQVSCIVLLNRPDIIARQTLRHRVRGEATIFGPNQTSARRPDPDRALGIFVRTTSAGVWKRRARQLTIVEEVDPVF